MLRLLLVIEACGGGAGRHVIDLARGLLERGHMVHVAWSPARAEPVFVAGLATLRGLGSHPVAMAHKPSVQDVASLRVLRQLIVRHRFDLLHAHSSKAGALARLASLGSGVPVLYTPHAFITLDPDLASVQRGIYSLAERLLAPIGARIICVSEEEQQHAVRDLGIAAQSLVVVPNGLAPLPPPDRAGARNKLGAGEHEICIGFVGRLSSQKAVPRLIEAFAHASASAPAVRLAIVGEGPEQATLEALAGRLGIGGRVTFAGHGDGPALMAGFDLFVLPSRYEAFPYVLLEAAMRGLPIIAMEVGGTSALVKPGENGFVLPQDASVAEFAGALRKLVSDASLRRQMGRKSAEIASDFTLDRMVGQTLRVYAECRSAAGRDLLLR